MQKNSSSCFLCAPSKARQSGKSNGNWKGGILTNPRGYRLRWFPDHPRSVSSKYVFEHILVMEEHLGRYLLPGENVHHKNGIKDDNDISNLELWCKPQPSGIRAVDALAHARAVVELYEMIEDKL